jgi:2,3,4,5-tetrahydropyridine-2-carboxylate N-succinyltransferase
MTSELERMIDAAWEARDQLTPETAGPMADAVAEALHLLDSGRARVAEPPAAGDGAWRVNQWLKKAVLLSFRLQPTVAVAGGPGGGFWYDKVRPKFAGWDEDRFGQAGFRAVPGCQVRYSAFVAPGAVLMPCFINVGARVEEEAMIDTWATVGSCAQIGRRCHISGGAGIGGVLEPLQANPVIIEDDTFIGARAEVAEGVRIGRGSVLSMGVYIGASTRIVDRATGEILYGHVPPFSVVVSGTMPGQPLPDGRPGPGLYCAVIVKRVDEKTRAKTSINELLRD